jgi:AraC-like DNA-binding protein
MKKENLYEPFSIRFETIDSYSKDKQTNTFFQLVYVLSGKGTKHINGCEFTYHVDQLFLLTPSDYYFFTIESTTTFFFLRFNEHYLKSHSFLTATIHNVERILMDAKDLPGCFLKSEADSTLIKQMIAIMQDSLSNDVYSKALVQQFVTTIIVLTARNIAQVSPLKAEENTEASVLDILRYVQKNINSPEKISAVRISTHFKISTTQLGRYFKRHTDETMRQYITNYKTRLIENRLIYSDHRINEIAGEFGFADVSHFVKFFKKQKGNTPTKFRKISRTQYYIRESVLTPK